jgi:AraC-like DNA-binding protein
MLSTAGGGRVSQREREADLHSGIAMPFSMSDAMVTNAVLTPHCLNVSLRRRMLATMVPDLEDRFLRLIPRENEALRLLTRYVCLFDDRQPLAKPELRRLAVDHVYDLAALALGASRDAAEKAKSGGVRAARIHAIKADILASRGRNELTLAAIAGRHGVSPRYVQMLFEREGTTFSQFLLVQRLARAHGMLSDSSFAGRPISAVAYAAGFGDLSHFNRAFRRHYGESPSDVRASARRRGN